jgi:hypothetical protein
MAILSVRSIAIYLLLACPEINNHQVRAKGANEAGDTAEMYAVYSAILAHPPVSHGEPVLQYAIAETTMPVKDRTPTTACTEVPRINADSLAEVQSDFAQHNSFPMRLKRAFSLPKPYVLLSAQQAIEFERQQAAPIIQTDPPGPAPVSPAEGAIDLFQLSHVFFDRPHKFAMVYVSAWCGTTCSLWGWHVLEKTASGRWQEITQAKCSAFIS